MYAKLLNNGNDGFSKFIKKKMTKTWLEINKNLTKFSLENNISNNGEKINQYISCVSMFLS